MDWQDDAIVLSTRAYGELAAIAMLMTRERGRHAGLVHGRRRQGGLEPGARVRAHWRARLADQLGTLTLEPVSNPAGGLLDDPLRLAALSSALAVVDGGLAERSPYPGLFDALCVLLDQLGGPFWDAAYVQWELGVLTVLGFGLDLERCAVSGSNDMLRYVSPRTGRAVSAAAGEDYRDRLLALPGFLIGQGSATPEEVAAGLALTGHFLERAVFANVHRAPPPARDRYVERYRRHAATSGRIEAP